MIDSLDTGGDGLSLLDLLVILAESWVLLIAGPAVIGLLTFAFIQFQPHTYESWASLRLSPAEIAAVRSEAILQAETADITAKQIDEGLSVDAAQPFSVNSVVKLRLARYSDVQRVLTAVVTAIDHIAKDTVLAERRAGIEGKLQVVNTSVATRYRIIERLNDILESAEKGDSVQLDTVASAAATLSTLLSNVEEMRRSQITLEAGLAELSTTTILSAPSAAYAVGARSPIIVGILAAIASGFLLLVFVFVREGVRRAADDPQRAEKIARIAWAFGLKPRQSQRGLSSNKDEDSTKVVT